jgi:hypothetical protein
MVIGPLTSESVCLVYLLTKLFTKVVFPTWRAIAQHHTAVKSTNGLLQVGRLLQRLLAVVHRPAFDLLVGHEDGFGPVQLSVVPVDLHFCQTWVRKPAEIHWSNYLHIGTQLLVATFSLNPC